MIFLINFNLFTLAFSQFEIIDNLFLEVENSFGDLTDLDLGDLADLNSIIIENVEDINFDNIGDLNFDFGDFNFDNLINSASNFFAENELTGEIFTDCK